ncbi:MAG: hypothetical protein LBC95_02405 [Candidatus Nomurabacteria bacterium]|jgi:hypothetical protein|nr:hypothetical protein [Candidatus Nomurabacteria bacterium]
MSKSTELDQQLVKWRSGTIDELPQYFPGQKGVWLLEIYNTAAKLFPNIAQLQPNKITVIYGNAGVFAGGNDGDANVANIALGTGEIVSRNLKSRISIRLGGTASAEDIDSTESFIQLFALAHEIGHIIQGNEIDGSNEDFIELFGDDINRSEENNLKDEGNYTDEEYTRYVQWDKEANADFIALYILGNWEKEAFGDLDPVNNGYRLTDWKKWADDHKIIARDGVLFGENTRKEEEGS